MLIVFIYHITMCTWGQWVIKEKKRSRQHLQNRYIVSGQPAELLITKVHIHWILNKYAMAACKQQMALPIAFILFINNHT